MSDLKVLTNIAASVTALGTALGGLAVTGVLERAQRDEGELLLAAFVLVVAASVLWVAAALFKQTWLQVVALIAFGGGLLCGVGAVIRAQDISPRPSLSASIDEDGVLAGSVKAEGLKSTDRIAIVVDGLQVAVDPKTRQSTFGPATNVFQAFAGPDQDGKVNVPLHLAMPAGAYGAVGVRAWTTKKSVPCQYPEEVDPDVPLRGTRIGAGCVVLPLALVPKRPRLSLRWSGATARAVDVRVSATNSPTDRLLVVQVVTGGRPRSRVLARALLEPDTHGVAEGSWSLPVAGTSRSVCAEARFIKTSESIARLRCPLAGRGPTAAIAQLSRTPSRR